MSLLTYTCASVKIVCNHQSITFVLCWCTWSGNLFFIYGIWTNAPLRSLQVFSCQLSCKFSGKRAFIAGVADDNGYGWAIAKALAAAGAEILVGTWVPVSWSHLWNLSDWMFWCKIIVELSKFCRRWTYLRQAWDVESLMNHGSVCI